jgi:hypothetical protein
VEEAEVNLTIETIAAMLAEELRRLPCRVDHSKERCKKCEALALYNAHIAIVQRPRPPEVFCEKP